MGKVKKTFDTESMYKKIMPSSNLSNLKPDDEIPAQKSVPADADAEEKSGSDSVYAQNVMSYIVREKMKMVMEKMDCCRCEKCDALIFTQVINQFAPKYIVGTDEELTDLACNCDSALGLQVTTVVLREVLALRRNPIHGSEKRQ
ncbi:MAG: late competence development ComFB family protein [Anaerofustis sp.]